jgi:hypothetical protein
VGVVSQHPIQPSHPSWVLLATNVPDRSEEFSWRGKLKQDEKVLMPSWSPTSFVIVVETICTNFGRVFNSS